MHATIDQHRSAPQKRVIIDVRKDLIVRVYMHGIFCLHVASLVSGHEMRWCKWSKRVHEQVRRPSIAARSWSAVRSGWIESKTRSKLAGWIISWSSRYVCMVHARLVRQMRLWLVACIACCLHVSNMWRESRLSDLALISSVIWVYIKRRKWC